MDPYLIAFLLIVLIGSVTVYIYYLKEKREELASIERGFCPKCHQDTIELTDKRGGGCSGATLLTFTCTACGYTNSFATQGGGSCGSGGCSL